MRRIGLFVIALAVRARATSGDGLATRSYDPPQAAV
jgi:hypothetical protein